MAVTAVAVVVTALAAVGAVLLTRDDAAAGGPRPFAAPSPVQLADPSRQVLAHYFPPYPISLDNEPAESDYYATHYLDPQGEGGRHAAYGGFLRERPLPRPVSSSPDWRLEDLRTEVRWAAEAGITGFAVDVLALEDEAWEVVEGLAEAAAEVPGFSIVLMPDSTSSTVEDPGALAEAVADLAGRVDTLARVDGNRLVVAPFAPELLGATWWEDWVGTMQDEHGIDVALVPCFLTYDDTNADAFGPFSHGFGNWGDRSPDTNRDLQSAIDDAHARGKIWMQPVSLQDQRPAQGVWDEAENTGNLRRTWQAAIDGGADWVQMVTWNDYSESTEFAPSTHIGWSPLDISAYYAARFRSGEWPAIEQDALYVSHRVQFARARPSGHGQLMELRSVSGPPRDEVEVLSFLTAPATVRVQVGGTEHEYRAPAGVSARTVPLEVGSVQAEATRDGDVVATVASPFPVVDDPVVQDLLYHFANSLRDDGDPPLSAPAGAPAGHSSASAPPGRSSRRSSAMSTGPRATAGP